MIPDLRITSEVNVINGQPYLYLTHNEAAVFQVTVEDDGSAGRIALIDSTANANVDMFGETRSANVTVLQMDETPVNLRYASYNCVCVRKHRT